MSWTTSCYPREDSRGVYSSPPSSEPSSGCEDTRGGRTRIRPIHQRRTASKLDQTFSQKIHGRRESMQSDAYLDIANSRYSSATNIKRRTSPSSGEIYVTAMDEDDHQMFIALFYWRRKVIEAHFSAWKWVVFTLRQPAKQIHRRSLKSHPGRLISTDYDSIGMRQPRQNLILKRHTGRPSADESVKNESIDDFQNSDQPTKLTQRYMTPNERKRDYSPLVNNPPTDNNQPTEKRRQFRAHLRLVYSCFRQWKCSVKTAKRTRVEQLVRASDFHRAQKLKAVLRAWRRGSRKQKLRQKRRNDADQYYCIRIKRGVIHEWRRYCRVEHEIIRRQKANATQHKRFYFHHWYRCILKTRKCRKLAAKRRHNYLHLTFKCFQEGVRQAEGGRLKFTTATSHYHNKLHVSIFLLWREAVFEDPLYLQSIDHGTRISLLSGVRKWRRFTTDREQRARKVLLADFFRYRASLRRGLTGWALFLELRRQRKQIYDEVRRHYDRNIKRNGIQQLRAAAHVNQTRRRQVRMVTRWHQRKFAARVFRQWIAYTHKRARLDMFRRATNTRRLHISLHVWREQAAEYKRLKTAHCMVSTRRDTLLLKTCVTMWVRKQRINGFVLSLELKHRNTSIARHFSAWHDWRDKKALQRFVVDQQLLRSDQALLEHVVSKWFGETLRKRCLKRLVKLFRKKQARHRIKFIFRLWRVHVRACIASRKWDLDQARLSLVEWKIVCKHLKEKRMLMNVAMHYYRERRYAMTIGCWSAFARKSRIYREVEGKALLHYFRRIMIQSLQHWYLTVREFRRQAEFLAYRHQLRDNRTMLRCLHAWCAFVMQRIQDRRQEWAALQFQMVNLQRRSFYSWFQVLQARRLSNEIACSAMCAYENKLQGRVVRAWHMWTHTSIQLQRKCVVMHRTMKQSRLQSSIAKWTKFCFERQRSRRQIAMAKRFYGEYLLCITMYHWQDKWSQASILRHKRAKVITTINARRLEHAVSRWYENYMYTSRLREKKTEVISLHTRKLLTQHFRLWKCYRNAIRHKVSKRRFVSRLRQQKLQSRMFRRWQYFSKTKAIGRSLHQLAVQHNLKFVLGLAFQSWKRYRTKRTLHIIAYRYRIKALLQKVWLGWKLHRQYVAKVRQNILVTNQLLRSNLFRATFLQWKSYASRRQMQQAKLYIAEDHYVQWGYNRAITLLRNQAMFHRAVVQAATFGHINGARHCWRRWQRFVAIRRSRRRQHIMAEQSHLQRWQRKHFKAWKSLTKRRVLGRRDKSDALYRASCMRMVWTRWQRAVDWRRCMVAMGFRRLDNLQSVVLCKWRTHTKERIEAKAKKVRAVAFENSQLRLKAWRSWLRYITRCHDKQKQLIWVLSYYSVEVLLRRSLESWKTLVVLQKAQQENNESAALFNTHRLIRYGYNTWRVYVDVRKMKLERFEAQERKVEILALSRSVQKWRSRTTVWHQHRQNHSRAARLYNRKRLVLGLINFMRWRDSQKTIRSLIIQAKHFKDSKAVAASFRCWQRYHQWRRRYAHLTRVFKQNFKGDAFAHWKTYWQERRWSSEKRLQARIFHCVHLEQSVLAAWRLFVHTQKHQKMARAFSKLKVIRTTFNLWKRRIHVLRQMRKMFLYQELFRAQTHFDAWKRFVVARRQLNERVRRAMMFKDNLCKSGVWQKWNALVFMKQQERETINLAVGFRHRFFTRKILLLWRGRARQWRRKRLLVDQALLLSQNCLLRRGFEAFAIWREARVKLVQLQRVVTAHLVDKRKRGVIANLRALCAETVRKRGLIKRACSHWHLIHQQKYWSRIMQWFEIAKFRKLQCIQADAFARSRHLRRCIGALQSHICHTKQVRAKIDAFRCRYFRSVADDCFYRWRSFTSFKQKLRVLRRKSRQGQRRLRLQQWHRIALEQVRRRVGMHQIAINRRRRELITWFNHWESVCTDQWIEKELVAHHQRHGQKQRMLRSAVKTLKSQLPARYERQKRKRFFLQHHKASLIQVLQHWRAVAVTSTCDV